MADDNTADQTGSGSAAGGAGSPPAATPPPVAPTITTAAMPQFKPGQIANAPEVKPEKPSVQPLAHIYVGFTLAKIFSGILAGYLFLAICSIWFSEAQMLKKMDSITQGLTIKDMTGSESQTNTITKDNIDALTKSVSEAYRDTRAATIEFHKTVIINVLLPILTALLGYIFGNRENNEPNQNSK